MAFDAFLKIEGIEGESTDKAHKDEIEISSFSWGETQHGHVERRRRRSRQGPAPGLPLHDADEQGVAEPDARLRNRDALPKATLTCRKAGGSQVEFLKIKLADVLVSSYSWFTSATRLSALGGRTRRRPTRSA